MAKSIRGAADRIHTARMFGPCNRMESMILASNSTKLLCLLPTLPNSSRAGQGHSGVKSRGEARTRAHRGDSSGRRTSPPIPAPGSVVIVRRCSTIKASDILPWFFESKQTVREPRPDFITATNSFLHSPLCEPDHLAPLLQSFKVPCSPAQLLRQTANRCRRGFR